MAEQNTPQPISRGEYDRLWRVVDLMLSAHSILRDRNRRRQLSLTLLVMALSIAVTSLAFFSEGLRVEIGPLQAELTIWLGILAALIFFLSIVDLTVNWKRQAWTHEDAVRRLGELKSKLRAVTLVGNNVDTGGEDIRAEYERTMADLVEIPERRFLPMKVKHHRKVEISKLIDKHKGAPLPYLRLLVVLRGLRKQRDGQAEAIEPPDPIEGPPA